MKAVLGYDINRSPEQGFQFLYKSCWKPGSCLFAGIHKQVDITLSGCFATGHGPEDTHISGAVAECATENLFPSLPQQHLDWNILVIPACGVRLV